MYHLLKKLDQFGVEQQLQVLPLQPIQKSVFGGITSIILYSLSLAYFIYQIVDWQNNNKLPKYNSIKTKINQNESISCSETFAEIQYYKQLNGSFIDPFDPKNLIFQPSLLIVPSDWKNIKQVDLKFIHEESQDGSLVNKYVIQNITLVGQPQLSKTQIKINYMLSIKECNQSQLNHTEFQCANQSTISEFFMQQTYIQVSIYIEQFDAKTKTLQKIPKEYLIDVRKDFMQYTEFYLQVDSLTIDDGFLFPDSHKVDFFSDLQMNSLQYDLNYSIKYFQQELNAVFLFFVDTLKDQSTLEYPKISEILANTGSIVNFIMQISFLASQYNKQLSLQNTKKEIIKMYYGDYEQYKIKKSWKGQIQEVSKDGIALTQKQIVGFFSKLDTIAKFKINYLNLQHEISKLQLMVSKLLQPEQIKKYLESSNKQLISQLISKTQDIDEESGQSGNLKVADRQTEINNETIEEDLKNSIGLLILNPEKLFQLGTLNLNQPKY